MCLTGFDAYRRKKIKKIATSTTLNKELKPNKSGHIRGGLLMRWSYKMYIFVLNVWVYSPNEEEPIHFAGFGVIKLTIDSKTVITRWSWSPNIPVNYTHTCFALLNESYYKRSLQWVIQHIIDMLQYICSSSSYHLTVPDSSYLAQVTWTHQTYSSYAHTWCLINLIAWSAYLLKLLIFVLMVS